MIGTREITLPAEDGTGERFSFPRGAFERQYVEENECPKCDGRLFLREYRTARTYEAWAVCECGWRCEL